MAKKDKKEVVEEVVEEEVIIEEPIPEPIPEPTPEPKNDYKVVTTAKGVMRRYADGTMTPH
tara:strand:+ start:449 stop:631 length:183 start_codon:yes stop_codon:yes gene_type:complete